MLLDEKPDARHCDEDAGVQKRFKLGPDRDELAASDAEKRRRLGVREDALLAQAEDGGFDFGVDGGSLALGAEALVQSGGEGRIRTGGRVISPTAV